MGLYVSFRNPGESWTEGRNMGKDINTAKVEAVASAYPEEPYPFFAISRNGNTDIYWVDAESIEEFRPNDLK